MIFFFLKPHQTPIICATKWLKIDRKLLYDFYLRIRSIQLYLENLERMGREVTYLMNMSFDFMATVIQPTKTKCYTNYI